LFFLQHILKKITGNWEKGFVIGKLYEEGWGADMGFPGIRLEEKTEIISGYVFSSDFLKDNWQYLGPPHYSRH